MFEPVLCTSRIKSVRVFSLVHVQNQVGTCIFALGSINLIEFTSATEFILRRFYTHIQASLRKSAIQVMIAITSIKAHRLGIAKDNIHLGASTKRIIAFRMSHPLFDQTHPCTFIAMRSTGYDYCIDLTHNSSIYL